MLAKGKLTEGTGVYMEGLYTLVWVHVVIIILREEERVRTSKVPR
jgi:hypothetical protein